VGAADTIPLRPGPDPAPPGPVEDLAATPAAGNRTATPPPAVEPLLLTADQAAALLGVSPATFYRMRSAGRTPAPLRLSPGCVRYSRETLVEWVRLGCPSRKEFEARQATATGRGRK
jgi:predicted DNA-binding transcriptional regulator AlpA